MALHSGTRLVLSQAATEGDPRSGELGLRALYLRSSPSAFKHFKVKSPPSVRESWVKELQNQFFTRSACTGSCACSLPEMRGGADEPAPFLPELGPPAGAEACLVAPASVGITADGACGGSNKG